MAFDDVFPILTDTDLRLLESFGTRRRVSIGDVLFRAGDDTYEFFAIVSGTVQIINEADAVDDVVIEHGPGRFLGEINLLTGQRVVSDGTGLGSGRCDRRPCCRVAPADRHQPGAERHDPHGLRCPAGDPARGIGQRHPHHRFALSSATLALREFLVRNQLPHQWLDVEADSDVARLASEFGLEPADYPVALTSGAVLRQATPGMLGSYLRLTAEALPERCVDVVVIGAGPAGLAASVYAASEGLRTVTIESIAPGGQAGTSSRIENYLGFPSGVSGLELTNRALTQARKFGAALTTPCEAVRLFEQAGHLIVELSDGSLIGGRALIVATGAHYRRLDLARLTELEGAGVYYAATDTEVRMCIGAPVVVVGGGNSAGQAALHLAKAGCDVTLVVRAHDLAESMSSYLSDRIAAHPRITLRSRTVVAELHGDRP